MTSIVTDEAESGRRGSGSTGGPTVAARPVAYIMSRFPSLTETFILREMLELEDQGQPVAVFPLIRMELPVRHAGVERILPKVHFTPFLNLAIVAANLRFLGRSPRRYVGLLWTVLRGCWGSSNLFVGALGIFPKSVYLAQVMEERGIRHVHAHFATHPALAALIISELTGATFSFSAHAHDFFVDIQMLCTKLAKATFIVTHCDFNKRYLLGLCPETPADKIAVVRDGIELAHYGKRRGEKTGGPYTILCVASLQPYKGVEYLVRACGLLKSRLGDFRCLLVGEGRERPKLERLISELELDKTVRLLGGRPHDEVVRLLDQADAFVAPSVEAPDGQMDAIQVAVIEALASYLPVVSTDLSAIPELIKDGITGLLVPPADAAALADAIVRLHDSPELCQTLGRQGRDEVAAAYQLGPNVARLRSLYAGVLCEGSESVENGRAESSHQI